MPFAEPSRNSRHIAPVPVADIFSSHPMPDLSAEEVHRRDCLARHLLNRWTRHEIVDWLNDPKKNDRFREDMRERLNSKKHATKIQ
jgi:Mn-dependent DtxR family transcriptional regulator